MLKCQGKVIRPNKSNRYRFLAIIFLAILSTELLFTHTFSPHDSIRFLIKLQVLTVMLQKSHEQDFLGESSYMNFKPSSLTQARYELNYGLDRVEIKVLKSGERRAFQLTRKNIFNALLEKIISYGRVSTPEILMATKHKIVINNRRSVDSLGTYYHFQ